MVNALLSGDLAARLSGTVGLVKVQLLRQRSVPKLLVATGVLGLLAFGLPSTPQSQTLSALAIAAETSDVASFEPLTFADRFADDVKDLPPTVGVSVAASVDPRATRFVEYAASLEGRAAQGAERVPSETTGSRQ